MKFCWCTINVLHMDESLKFYQEIVGLPLNRRFFSGPSKEISFLGDGETQIELICKHESQALSGTEGIAIGFEVESIDEMIKFLKERGVEIEGEIYQPNPYIKFIYVRDPNGVRIQFVENIA